MKTEGCANVFGLLSILSNSEWRSGQQVANELGISRAAVWKRIQKLSELGFDIERSRRFGYRLAQGIESLDRWKIKERLKSLVTEPPEVSVVGATASTNTALLDHLRRGDTTPPCVLLAEMQTAGRGRRGRAWVSPPGRNIYMSYGWRCGQGVAGLSGLSLAVGVILADAVEHAASVSVELKWPNDLLIQSKKFGGVLIDIDGDFEGAVNVVIGIGINMQMGGGRAARIDQPWTELQAHAVAPISRNEIAAQIIASLSAGLTHFGRRGFSFFRDKWISLDSLSGKEVRVNGHDHGITGREVGVTLTGNLLIETERGIMEVNSGDVSLRKL